MKIYSLIIALFFAGTLSVNAQDTTQKSNNPQLKWYSLNKSTPNDLARKLIVVGEDEKNIYAYYPTDDQTSLETSLKANKLLQYNKETGASKELTFKLNGYFSPENKNIEFVVMINDKLQVFYSDRNKLKNNYTLYTFSVNKESFTQNSDTKNVLEFSYKKDNGLGKVGVFSYNISPDKSKILFTYHFKNTQEKIARYGFYVTDNNFTTLWKSENALSNTSLEDACLQPKKYVVNNNGDVYLLGSIYESSSDAIKNQHTNKAVIVHFPKQNAKVEILNVTLSKGKYVKTADISINKDNNVVCAGVYSQGEMTNVIGSFAVTIGSDNKVSALETPFTSELLTQDLSDKDSAKLMKNLNKGNDFEEWDYAAKNIYFKKDGTFQLVVEKFNQKGKVKRETNDYAVKSFKYEYGDLLVVNFKNDNSVKWMQKIEKFQKVKNHYKQLGTLGIAYGANDELFFFYNQMGSNGSKVSKSHLMLTTVDNQTGKDATIDLYDTDDNNILVRPSEHTTLQEATIILFGQKGTSKSTILKINNLPENKKVEVKKIDDKKIEDKTKASPKKSKK